MSKSNAMAAKILKLKQENVKILRETGFIEIIATEYRNGTISTHNMRDRKNNYVNPFSPTHKVTRYIPKYYASSSTNEEEPYFYT